MILYSHADTHTHLNHLQGSRNNQFLSYPPEKKGFCPFLHSLSHSPFLHASLLLQSVVEELARPLLSLPSPFGVKPIPQYNSSHLSLPGARPHQAQLHHSNAQYASVAGRRAGWPGRAGLWGYPLTRGGELSEDGRRMAEEGGP